MSLHMVRRDEMMEYDWDAVRNAYVCGEESLSKLAARFGIPVSRVKQRSAREGWAAQRQQYREKQEKASPEERIAKMAELLLEKLRRAAEELDVYTSVSKTRRKESQYSDKGKLTGETVTEKESRETFRDVIDRSGLKQLTAALKDLKDIQSALAQEREGFVGGVVEIAAVAEEGQELEEEENQDG